MVLGCVNQAGEDNRNVARFAALLAGLPPTTPGCTVNRLCASGLQAVVDAARAITCGEGDLYIAGGVESMSRAPYVISKPDAPYGRDSKMYDTTIGVRFPEREVHQAVRQPLDARDRRQRRQGFRHHARAVRRIRPRLAAEVRHGREGRLLQGRDHGGHPAGEKKDADQRQ